MSKKRRLTEINDGAPEPLSVSPPLKKPKLEESADDNASMCILKVTDVCNMILDHLPFDEENFETFMQFGDNKYFQSRLMLKKNEITLIKSRIDTIYRDRKSEDEMQTFQSETQYILYRRARRFDVHKVCVLFGNIKSVFGEAFFRNILLNIPFGRTAVFTEDVCSRIDDNFRAIGIELSDDDTYFDMVQIDLQSPIDITNLFDPEQLQAIQPHVHLASVKSFTFRASNDHDHAFRMTWYAFNAAHDEAKPEREMFTFVCAPKPQLYFMPIFTRLLPSPAIIHTKHLLSTVEMVGIMAKSTLDHDFRSVELAIDHAGHRELPALAIGVLVLDIADVDDEDDVDDHELPLASLALHVNVNFVTIPATRFLLYRGHKNGIPQSIKFNFLDKYSPTITPSELKGFTTMFCNPQYLPHFNDDEYMGNFEMDHGILQLRHGQDVFHFRFVAHTASSGYRLVLIGCNLNGFSHCEPQQISTSQIPAHWEIVKLGNDRSFDDGPNPAAHMQIMIDRFPPLLKQFSVIDSVINMRSDRKDEFCPSLCVAVGDLQYHDIPPSLQLIELPVVPNSDGRNIVGDFPFLSVSNNQRQEPLPHKKVKFVFSIPSFCVGKLFQTLKINRMFYAQEEDHHKITISQKRL